MPVEKLYNIEYTNNQAIYTADIPKISNPDTTIEKICIWMGKQATKNSTKIYTLDEIKTAIGYDGKNPTLRAIIKQLCKNGFCTETKPTKQCGRPYKNPKQKYGYQFNHDRITNEGKRLLKKILPACIESLPFKIFLNKGKKFMNQPDFKKYMKGYTKYYETLTEAEKKAEQERTKKAFIDAINSGRLTLSYPTTTSLT